jgi:UDP-glucose 4-epimerase
MAVLVTGGAGYIGSIAVHQLLAAGEEVVVLDDLSMGHRAAVPAQAAFVEGNILDRVTVDSIFAAHAVDTVMHFAAKSLVGESMENPDLYFENNVTGAQILLGSMVRAGVKRFILSSTAATYGMPDSMPITEDFPVQPINPYGRSKRMIEEMLAWYDRAYGMKWIALRYFNAAGAIEAAGEDHEPETHLIPNVIRAATGKRDKIMVFGNDYPTPDGTCVRDYIHVADLADAHLRAMAYLRNGGESDIFNLGNAQGTSVLEVIEAVKQVSGRDFPVEIAERRPGDPPVLVASSEKAERVLGWKPQRPDIATITADAWAWDITHPEGYGGA